MEEGPSQQEENWNAWTLIIARASPAVAAVGVGTHVHRDPLGHKATAMADRYIRTVGNRVRDAAVQVSGAIAAMMTGTAGDVVPMRRRSG